MTENPQPPKRGGLAWQKARRLLKSALDDWPESFTPGELAALQYPREGTDPEKRKALSNQKAMIDAIKASIEQGEAETVTGTREVSVLEKALDYRARRGMGYALRDSENSWFERDFAPRTVLVKKKETREVQAIARPTFAAWLRASGFGDDEGQEKPSEHIRAWLGNVLQATPEHPNATIKAGGNTDEIPGTLPPRAAGKLAIKAAWLIECETKRRASAKEVMARLQKWADDGEEPAVLVKSLPAKRAVQWLTTKGKHLEYTLEACEKTLEKWAESQK